MKKTTKPKRPDRLAYRQLVTGGTLSAMLLAQNAAAFTISDVPLFLPKPMEPNIVLTVDDSASMAAAYVPESLNCGVWNHPFLDRCPPESLVSGSKTKIRDARSGKSSHRNALYYDPQTVYPLPVFVSVDGTRTTPSTSFTSAPINGYADGGSGRASSRGTVNLAFEYRPTWDYDPSKPLTGQVSADHPGYAADLMAIVPGSDGQPPDRTKGGRAYYYVWSPTNADCSSSDINDDDCYSLRIVGDQSGPADVDGDKDVDGDDERLNFAIWYSFYRTRNLLTVAAASRAMLDVPDWTRVGWQSLRASPADEANGQCPLPVDPNDLTQVTCVGWSRPEEPIDNRIREFGGAHRNAFYRWLFRLPAPSQSASWNYTPLRSAAMRIGRYFSTSGVNSPYAQKPQVELGREFSCRPNFHVLMTDGYWNSDQDSTASFCGTGNCGNVDNTSRNLPDGKRYDTSSDLTRIFRSSDDQSAATDNLADIGFYYWATDLRPDLPDNLLPYRSDRTGTADQQYWNPKNDLATWQHLVTFTVGLGLKSTLNLTNPDRSWQGSTYAGTGYTNFLSGAASWPATGAAGTWPSNKTDPALAQARVYDLWHAAINSRGQSFSADTPKELSDALRAALNRILERQAAAAALATNSARLATDSLLFQARFTSDLWTGGLTAFTLNSDGSVGPAKWEASVPAHGARNIVTWSGAAGITFTESSLRGAGLWLSSWTPDLLNYLRGDTSKEKRNGGSFRDRAAAFGDIVNSDPAFVHAQNYGYSSLPEGGYASFVASKKSRAKMLYVGANDGFLRGFDVDTGVERFAYVPNAVMPKMAALASPAYAHRYFVDGPPTAWDAHFSGGWRTVLVGTTGAGAKAVFALDVTDPASFSAGNVLWEINAATAKRAEEPADPEYGKRLGYTIGQAVVAKLRNGEWAAIFGNGYGSDSHEASLYVVRVSDGQLIRRIDTGVGTSAAPNGLGTPTLYDVNGDDVYDVVYAPDMRGNVWKFSLADSDAGSWKIAFESTESFTKGAPLFQARNGGGDVQPITARIELASPPPGKPGIMVLFGTGRFFAVGDNTDTTRQSFYGLWDNGSPVTGRSLLQEQTVSTSDIDLRGMKDSTVRTVSGNPIDWSSQRGWYIDLPTSMERVIGTAVVRDNRVIFTTLIPSDDPCEFGGSGWLMEVSAATGAKLPYAVFDTSGDQLVTAADRDVSGMPIRVGMVKTPLAIDGSPTAAKFLSGTKGEIQLERNRTFGRPLGRESWREVRR